ARMRKMTDAMCACADAACVEKVTKDYADWTKSMEEKYKGDRKPDERLIKMGEEMSRCVETSMSADKGNGGVDGSSSDHTATASCGRGGPYATSVPECDGYLAAFDEYMSCDKIPQQAKDASCQGVAEMRQGWATLKDPSIPAEARKSAGDACRQATDALAQSAEAMGCPLSIAHKAPPPPAKKKRPKRH